MSTASHTVRVDAPSTPTEALDAVERIMIRRAAAAGYEATRRPFAPHWEQLGPLEQDRYCLAARAVMQVMARDIVGSVRALEGDD